MGSAERPEAQPFSPSASPPGAVLVPPSRSLPHRGLGPSSPPHRRHPARRRRRLASQVQALLGHEDMSTTQVLSAVYQRRSARPVTTPSTSSRAHAARSTLGGSTAPNWRPSSSPPSGSTTPMPPWLCSLDSRGCGCARAYSANVEDLAVERGHRTLRIVGEGNKGAVIPPGPSHGPDHRPGHRRWSSGPVLSRQDGELDRRSCPITWVIRCRGARRSADVLRLGFLERGPPNAAVDVGTWPPPLSCRGGSARRCWVGRRERGCGRRSPGV